MIETILFITAIILVYCAFRPLEIEAAKRIEDRKNAKSKNS